ncbi:hypothetical protein [Halomarina oriensis]|uniref:Uncharacterized protein n=1 Tax=Halomarina oriensis TaxID=671145 RepID=A0A6B0GJ77_9EURY|nr:hypothetical protein [Halomarina oriensis]MWG34834.1 hypothetical protein [Halomarina oriensis]
MTDPAIDPKRIPWRLVRRALRYARSAWFVRPEPSSDALAIDCSHDELRRALGERHFEPNWETAYLYRGEVENLRRVTFAELPPVHDESDDLIVWWQTHVRTWDHEGAFEIKARAHWEPEPTEFPDAHLDGIGFDRTRAMETLRSILDEEGIDYEHAEP